MFSVRCSLFSINITHSKLNVVYFFRNHAKLHEQEYESMNVKKKAKLETGQNIVENSMTTTRPKREILKLN